MILKNIEKIPPGVIPALQKHAQVLLDSLGEKLTGIYVHGSAAMGGFTTTQSDFDYLVTISSPLTPNERKKLSDSFLEIYGKDAPANGIEMSIVVEKFAEADFQYPTPYEFHMGTEEQVRFHGLPHESEKTGDEKCTIPQYAVLNFCRVLAFIEDRLIASKLENKDMASQGGG